MKKFALRASPLFIFCSVVNAGFGGMDKVEEQENGELNLAALPAMAIGAAIGYYIERSINRRNFERNEIRYSSDSLGGKMGAIAGAFILPLIIGILR